MTRRRVIAALLAILPITGMGCADLLWSTSYGGPTAADYVDPSGVVLDSMGVTITGGFVGAVDFGGGVITGSAGGDIFLAHYTTAKGEYLWAKGFNATQATARALAADGAGNLLITGEFIGTLDLGGGAFPTPLNVNGFVGKFSPTAGAHVWSKAFSFVSAIGTSVLPKAIVADASGNVYVTGGFTGPIDFGGGILTSAGNRDIFLVKFSSAGVFVWAKRFGSTSTDNADAIAIDVNGNVTIAGDFTGAVDFGGGPFSGSGGEIYLASFDTNGVYRWAKDCSGLGKATGLDADPSGNIFVVGYSSASGVLDFGGGPVPNLSIGHYAPFLAKLTSTGAHAWSKVFSKAGANGDATAYAAGVSSNGSVIFTGYLIDDIDFGGGALQPISGTDTYIVKFDTDGTHIRSKRYPQATVTTDAGRAIAVLPNGTSAIIGDFVRSINFGGGNLVNAGGTSSGTSVDVFVTKWAP